jgi:hypothetical protein
MSRDYYIHKRKNGFFYVEFIDKEIGSKLSARSTGETEKLKAQIKAELWLVKAYLAAGKKNRALLNKPPELKLSSKLYGKQS